jgi:phage shock protein C
MSQTGAMREFRRPSSTRIIGGVCAAIANRFGWDVSLVRLVTALSILLPGPQVFAYIVCWIVIPSDRIVPRPPSL